MVINHLLNWLKYPLRWEVASPPRWVLTVGMEASSPVVTDELRTISKFLRDQADDCESSFSLRAKLLRDMSDLCKKGWSRLMEVGFHQHKVSRRVSQLRADPAVQEFVECLKSCNPEGLTDVAAMLGREFYELDRELQRREPEAPKDPLADRPGGVPKERN